MLLGWVIHTSTHILPCGREVVNTKHITVLAFIRLLLFFSLPDSIASLPCPMRTSTYGPFFSLFLWLAFVSFIRCTSRYGGFLNRRRLAPATRARRELAPKPYS